MLPWADTLYGVVKNGVLTLSGYSISVREENGCLLIRDGLKGRSEIELHLPRASCPVSRLVIVRSEGMVTLRAVRWLREIGASLIVLDYDGTPILITAPRANVRAELRRAQALLSLNTPLGASIARSLIHAKVTGQIDVLKHLNDIAAAAAASAFAARIRPHCRFSDLLGIEGRVAAIYWQSLASRTVRFGRQQAVPDHWKIFGVRHSPLSGTPLHAVTPANALANYLYRVGISELTIALQKMGLDPALGIMHADKDDRMSLCYDLVEPLRGIIDRWLFDWLETATFSKRDFREDSSGEIRVTHPLNSHLAMTAPLWRRSAEQLAEWFCKQLTDRTSRQAASMLPKLIDIGNGAGWRVERWRSGKSLQRPIPRTCRECGKTLSGTDRKFCSEIAQAPVTVARRLMSAWQRWRERGQRAKSALLAVFPKSARTSVREWQRQPNWSAARDQEMRD